MKANPNTKPEEILERILGEQNYSRFDNKMKEGSTGVNVVDTLVEDPAFASVLNSKGEVQVDSTTYRITPYGTFMYLPEKENQVDQKISELEKGNTIPETEQKPYLYKVDDGVYRYATFVEARDNTGEYTSGGTDSSVGNSTSSSSQKDIESYVVSVEQTGLGKFFGFSTSFSRNFDSQHRMKFKFSSPNFQLFTYINIKVKFQKKNGWGVWSKTKCDKIILGWDGLIYNLSKPMPVPQNGDPNVSGQYGYNYWAHGYWIPPYVNKQYLVLSIPGFNEKQIKITSNDLAKMYKAIFDWLKNRLDPRVMKNYLLAIMPNPNKIILGKTEYVSNNVKKKSMTFDFTTAVVGWNGSLDNGSGYPTVKLTKTIEIDKASVYGVVYYNNKWLGIRIEKK